MAKFRRVFAVASDDRQFMVDDRVVVFADDESFVFGRICEIGENILYLDTSKKYKTSVIEIPYEDITEIRHIEEPEP